MVGICDGNGKDKESRDAFDIPSISTRFPATRKARFAMFTSSLWTGIAQLLYLQFYCANDFDVLVLQIKVLFWCYQALYTGLL